MLLATLVATSTRVAATHARLAKIDLLAQLISQAGPADVVTAIAFLSGSVRQTKLGVGWAGLHAARPGVATAEPSLTLTAVDAALERLATTTGKGAAAAKKKLLSDLFAPATADEQDFLVRLLTGELRQGALEGLVAEAVARAVALPAEDVRRAAMVAGDLGAVAHAALTAGAAGIARFQVQLFRPIQPMLARSADGVADALAQLGTAAFEYKLDGARIQVHKKGTEVRVYSRLMNDVTEAVVEVVEVVKGLPVRDVILDGEAIALAADRRPLPFQVTMRRFGRKQGVAQLRDELPLSCCFFDILYVDGKSLLAEPYARRSEILAGLLPSADSRPRCLVTSDPTLAQQFFVAALAAGHEGVMAKSLAAPYDAGARGLGWLKIKQANTLDLVVLAAEWGHGRRAGFLSNVHLGARDPDNGGFVMLGKTFKGMTDEMLAWQTQRLQELEVGRTGHVVHVRAALVAEVAFNGLQESSHYPGGLALRFARVVRYREDKTAQQADTIDMVRALHKGA